MRGGAETPVVGHGILSAADTPAVGCSACPRRVRPGGTLPAASPGLPGRRPGTRSEVLNETLGVGQDPAGGRHSPQRLGLFRAAGKAGPRDQNGFCVA